MYGPFLSAIVGGRALTPPTRQSLGRLLPHQQADRYKAAPIPPRLNRGFTLAGSCDITPSFDELCHSKGYVPCFYSPVRLCPQGTTINNLQLTVYLRDF